MKIEQGTSNRLYTFNEHELAQHDAEIKKPLEDEIVELKEHIRALKSSHDLSHQAYLFAKNEGLDLQNQERQKVITELEKWADENLTKLIKRGYFLPNNLRGLRLVEYEELKQKLNEMKRGDRYERI